MEKKTDNKKTLKWILKIMLKSKWLILLMTIIQFALSICSISYAFLFKMVVDSASSKEQGLFTKTILMLIGLLALQQALRFIYGFIDEYVGTDIENNCKTQLLSALMKKDFASVTAIHSAEWLNRIVSDTGMLADGMASFVPSIAGTFTRLIGTTLAIFILDKRIIFVLFPFAVIVLTLTTLFRTGIKKHYKAYREIDGKLRIFLTERLSNQILIRSYVLQDQTVDEAKEWMKKYKDTRMASVKFSSFCNLGINGIFNGAYIICVVFCGYGILTSTMTFGNMTAVLQLANQIKGPFSDLSSIIPFIYTMMACAERLIEIEEYPDEEVQYMSDHEIKEFYENEFKGIGLEDITFIYPKTSVDENGNTGTGEPIFEDYSIEINKGDYVAFTGISGRGKSTLFKILLSLYPLTKGEGYIKTTENNIPLTAKWRSLFSYVPQTNALISGSIREIIALGNKEKMQDEAKINQALKIACANTFVDELENGIDTVLGENGTGLSEGQLQRIAIARAIFSDHPILLLDESTSALDDKTEHEVLANLQGLTDKTVLIITHRQASLAICNKHIDF